MKSTKPGKKSLNDSKLHGNKSYDCFFEDFGFPIEVIQNIFSKLKIDTPGYAQIKFHRKLRECQRILLFGINGKPNYPVFKRENIELILRFYDCINSFHDIDFLKSRISTMKSYAPIYEDLVEEQLRKTESTKKVMRKPEDMAKIFSSMFVKSVERHLTISKKDRHDPEFDYIMNHNNSVEIRGGNLNGDDNVFGQFFGYFPRNLERYVETNKSWFFGSIGMREILVRVQKNFLPGPKNWIFPQTEVDSIYEYELPLLTSLPYYLSKDDMEKESGINSNDYPIYMCDSVIQLEKLLTLRRKISPLVKLGMINKSFRKFIYSSEIMSYFWDEALNILHGTKISSPSHFKFSNNVLYDSKNTKEEISSYKELEKSIRYNGSSEEIDNDLNLYCTMKKSNSSVDKHDNEQIDENGDDDGVNNIDPYYGRSLQSPFSFFRAIDLVSECELKDNNLHKTSTNSNNVGISPKNMNERDRLEHYLQTIFDSDGKLVPLPTQRLLTSLPKSFLNYMSSFKSNGKLDNIKDEISLNYKMFKNVVTDPHGWDETDGQTRLEKSAQMFHDIEQSIMFMNQTNNDTNDKTNYQTNICNYSLASKISMVMTFLNFPVFVNTIPPWISEKYNLFSHFNLCNRFVQHVVTSDNEWQYSKDVEYSDKKSKGVSSVYSTNYHFNVLPNWINCPSLINQKLKHVRLKLEYRNPASFFNRALDINRLTSISKFDISYICTHDLRASSELYKIATCCFKTSCFSGDAYYSYDQFKTKYFGNFFVKLANYRNYYEVLVRFDSQIYQTYNENVNSIIQTFQNSVTNTVIHKHFSELDKVGSFLSGLGEQISVIDVFVKIFGYQYKFIKSSSSNSNKKEEDSENQGNGTKSIKNQKKFKKTPSTVSENDLVEVEKPKIQSSKKLKKTGSGDLDFENEDDNFYQKKTPTASKKRKTPDTNKNSSEDEEKDDDDDESHKKPKKRQKTNSDENNSKKKKKKKTTKKSESAKVSGSKSSSKKTSRKTSEDDYDETNDNDDFELESPKDLDKYGYHNNSSMIPKTKKFF